jgi:hypothetical protein
MKTPFVDITRIELAGIPTLKLTPKGIKGPLPTLIYYHGWSSNKENQAFRLSVFAAYSMQVFAPDAMHHGERGTMDYDAPGSMEKNFWEVILQNVQESSVLIEEIGKHNADAARLGVMGHSMGGLTTAGVFAANPNLQAMVSFNGSCAWLRIDEYYREKFSLDPASEEHLQRLAQYDPWSNRDCLQQRPVLMLNGGSDTTVPVDSQRWFYQQVAPDYEDCPHRLLLQEFPGVGHFIEVNMLEQAVTWFQKN